MVSGDVRNLNQPTRPTQCALLIWGQVMLHVSQTVHLSVRYYRIAAFGFRSFGLRHDDIIYNCLPLYHSAGTPHFVYSFSAKISFSISQKSISAVCSTSFPVSGQRIFLNNYTFLLTIYYYNYYRHHI